MAIVSFLTKMSQDRTRFQDYDQNNKDRFPDLLVVDATVSEVPTYELEPTDHPIEDGADITDHLKIKPVSLKIDGVISETPLTLSAALSSLTTTAGSAGGGLIGGFKGGLGQTAAAAGASKIGAKIFGNSSSPVTLARQQMRDLILKKKVFRIVTKYEAFDNMVLTSLSFTRDNTTGGSIKFSATARQITIVSSEVVTINIASGAAHSAGKKTKLGQQQADNANADQSKKSSILFKLGNFLGGG